MKRFGNYKAFKRGKKNLPRLWHKSIMQTYTATTTCVYSNPKAYDNTAPTLKTHAFSWGTVVCTTQDSRPTTTLSVGSTTVNLDGGYNGLNFYESLFIAGVIIFILSFSLWGKMSFTNVKKYDS